MAPDGELAARLTHGEQDAFAEVYAGHRDRLYLYLLSLVGRPEVAEELLQDTFVKLVTTRHRIRPEAPLGPYLATIARNLATDWLRRRQRERTAFSRVGLLASRNGTRTDLTPVEASELLWRLPTSQREAVVLRVYLGFTFGEVAAVTGAPLNTAVSRYRYGLTRLRNMLEEDSNAT